MCLAALRQFAGRFVVAATVILLSMAQIGSAQLLSAAHPRFEYEPDTYRWFPATVLAPVASNSSTVEHRPDKLQLSPEGRAAIGPIHPASESMQQMLRPFILWDHCGPLSHPPANPTRFWQPALYELSVP
jgi:hypothetical protein